jgi:hypothetical protein
VAKLEVERQKSILNILHGLRGIELLKKPFWTELKYERAAHSYPVEDGAMPLRAHWPKIPFFSRRAPPTSR